MSTRTVRLDESEEALLRRLQERTGQSISELIKRGLLALDRIDAGDEHSTAWEIYSRLDLGPGGYASGAAADSRRAAREAIPVPGIHENRKPDLKISWLSSRSHRHP